MTQGDKYWKDRVRAQIVRVGNIKLRKVKWHCYVRSLDNTLKLLAGGWTRKQARDGAIKYIQRNPAKWNEFDELVTVRVTEELPIEFIVGVA